MGLDMYLTGEKYYWSSEGKRQKEDGLEIKTKTFDLGYWRKHPNLHGYIVQVFNKGVDDCQDIELGEEQISQIIKAIKNKELPHTEGFFFGDSSWNPEHDANSIKIFNDALKWLKVEEKGVSRSVMYRASW